MDALIERHNSYEQKKKIDGIKKLEHSESRHRKNMLNEQKKLEDKAFQNKEKIFKNYMTFFFAKKNREKDKKLKISANDHRLQIKAEKIEELEREEEKKRNDLLKKLNKIEKRKKEILKHKNDKIIEFNKRRKEYIDAAKIKKEDIINDISDNRLDILDYQNAVLKRNENKESIINLKRMQINEKTINDQMNFEKNVKNFYKKLDLIKSENVMLMSLENRRKIFQKLKKKEAEKKKKEEEDKLLNMM